MANKKSLIGIVVLVLAVVGGGLFYFLRGGDAQEDKVEAEGKDDKQALLERKRAARASGSVDLSPTSATGRVTQASDGKPIPGAVVMLTPKGFEGRSLTPGQPADPITATTDDGGGWEIPKVAPGRYTLSATAEGYLPGRLMEVVLKAKEANGGLDLALVGGGHLLSGTITDIGGGPVEGVLVSVFRTDEGNALSFSRAPAAAVTDEDGKYRVTLATGDYAMGTQHADYVTEGRITSIRDGPRVEDFKLTPGAVIEGRVIARGSGAGVEDAIVTYMNSRGAFSTAGGGLTVNGFGEGRVHTDADGSFRLRGLQSGVVMVSAVAEGFATREPMAVPVGVAEQVSGVEVLVDPAFKISGFVVSRQDHEVGLEGVLVGAFSLSPTSLFVARSPSESDGYFEVLGVPPGGYNVGAIGEEALPNIFGTGATVVDADVDNVLVEMDRGAAVSGRVEPATAARIGLSQDFEKLSMGDMLTAMGNQFAQSRTDAEEGTFTLKPISPGKIKLVATADDGSKGEIEVDVPPEGLENVVISLEPRAKVSGRVIDASGAPVAKAQVHLSSKNGPVNLQINMGGGMQANQFPTGEDGSYLAKGLDPGIYEVQIKDSKGRTISWADPEDPEHPDLPVALEVEEGVDQAGVDYVIETRDGVIRGTVFDADGAPLPDAWVTAVRDQKLSEMLRGTRPDNDENVVKARVREKKDDGDEGGEDPGGSDLPMWFAETPVLTDEAGQFVIEDLKSGKYSLVAEGMKGSARARQDGVEAGDVVKLQLERLAGISGKVVQKGKPVTEYSVTLKGPSNRSKTVRNEEGTFLVDRIDPGDYEVVVTASVGTGEAEVSVEEGQSSEVKITLKGFGKVTGRLVDAQTGEPIPGAMVNVFNMAGGGFDGKAVMSMFTGMGPRTGADGRFEVGEVRPGKNQIMFMDRDAAMSGGNIASDEFEIDAEETVDLGEIRGLPSSNIPADERGELGMVTSVAKHSERPLHPDAEDPGDEEAPDGDEVERLWVLSIVKDGPAAGAGVEPGDEIVSVDGRGVDGLGAPAARSLLSPARVKAGQTVSLELERDGSRRSVTIEAKSREEDETKKKEG